MESSNHEYSVIWAQTTYAYSPLPFRIPAAAYCIYAMNKISRYQSHILWILLLWAATGAKAANAGYRYISRHFTMDNGLPQSSAGALAMDRRGFLWIATQGGLCRFDGSRFYTYNSRNSALRSDRIYALTLDERGNPLVVPATPYNHIYRIDELYRLVPDQRFQSSDCFFYNSTPVLRINPSLVLHDSKGEQRQLDAPLWTDPNRVAPVDSSHFYFIQKNALLLVNSREKSFRLCGLLPDWRFSVMAGDYLLTFDRHMRCQFWKDGMPLSVALTPAFSTFLQQLQQKVEPSHLGWQRNNSGATALVRVKSEIWLIRQKGIMLDAELLIDNLDKKQIVGSMLYDELNRTLFVGTATDGLYVYQRNDFNTIMHHGGAPHYIDAGITRYNNTYTQLSLGNQWALNANFRFDPFRNITQALPRDFHPATWSGFYRSPEGHIWYAASDNRMHIADSNLRPIRTMPFVPDSSNANITSFMEDEEHRVWVSSGNFVGRIEGETIRFLPLTSNQGEPNSITYLFSFDRDYLWLGTENGILSCNKQTGKRDTLLLPGNSIKYIFRAKDGGIWICTYGKGIYKYEAGGFVSLPADAGKCLLYAHSIVEDARGFFWIPTNRGLFQCSKAELEAYIRGDHKGSIYYYQHNKIGAYTDEFNGGGGNASIAWCGNLVLLPSIGGVLSFDPLRVQPLLPSKEILIEEIRSDGQLLPTDSLLQLPPDFHQLRMGVSAPYFGNRMNNVLEYQLASVSPDWYPVVNGAIIYNQLSPGSYHLRIRKRTGFGVENYAYRNLRFEVLPYWHQTWWFRISAVLLVALIIFYFVKRRISYLQRSKLKLEKIVNERTAELEETIAVLDSSEQELSRINMIQDQALAIILHDISSPIHYLSLSARYFNEQIQSLSEQELHQQAASFMNSTHRINKFTNDLVSWLRFNRDTRALNSERFDLATLLEEVKELYMEMARQKNNKLVLEATEPIIITADRNKLHLILRNLVDNANKYCSDGHITLSVRWTAAPQKIRIEVIDTGSGIPEDDIRKLKEKTTGPDLQEGKLGLAMVHYFVQLMNGTIEISREDGKRTVIAILLPSE